MRKIMTDVSNLITILNKHDYYLDNVIVEELDAFINHFVYIHQVKSEVLDNLISGFRNTKKAIKDSNQRCTFFSSKTSIARCSLSSNWGFDRKWNNIGAKVRSDVFEYFSNSIIRFVEALAKNTGLDPSIVLLEDPSYRKVFIEKLEVEATALQRISTEQQLRQINRSKEDEDPVKNDEFLGIVKSINKNGDDVAQYIRKGFAQECEFIYLKPIPGKANWTTLLFRVPLITNLFMELYKSTGKKLIARVKGVDKLLTLTELQRAILKGLETTETEKVTSYIPGAYNPGNRGHLTQLLIFTFGLFQYEPFQLVDMLKNGSKIAFNSEYLSRCVASAKNCIIDYKNSFMLSDVALEVYRNKLDEFEEMANYEHSKLTGEAEPTVCAGLKWQKSWDFCPKCKLTLEEHQN